MTPFATYIVETLVTLVAVVALAVLVLVSARRFGIGRPLGPLELVGRLPLEGRRAVYLVRVAGRIFVIGASEAGLKKLGELDACAVDLSTESKLSFRDVLSQVLDRRRERKATPPSNSGASNAETT